MVNVVINGSGAIDGLQAYSFDDICRIILRHIYRCVIEYDLDCEPIAITLHGSRIRHTSHSCSDLDAVIEYQGDEREDDCFNILNECSPFIEGIRVDINPIRAIETGDIASYLVKSRNYDNSILRGL